VLRAEGVPTAPQVLQAVARAMDELPGGGPGPDASGPSDPA
jgi:thioredoxin 1